MFTWNLEKYRKMPGQQRSRTFRQMEQQRQKEQAWYVCEILGVQSGKE